MKDYVTRILISNIAEKYLAKNEERFNRKEQQAFLKSLQLYLNEGSPVIVDEVYDFLLAEGIIKGNSRHLDFANYILYKYSPKNHKKILDVGAGRMCKLSTELAGQGFTVSAIDTNIRLKENELKRRLISKIIKSSFFCDEYSKNQGTPVGEYDLLVGLEPCEATEHIIRQGLKYDKPFEISLCYQPHKALSGQTFRTPELWYEYLSSISKEVKIIEQNNDFYATNNP